MCTALVVQVLQSCLDMKAGPLGKLMDIGKS
jgi:hypothetical protein